jgi:hypothetical protein
MKIEVEIPDSLYCNGCQLLNLNWDIGNSCNYFSETLKNDLIQRNFTVKSKKCPNYPKENKEAGYR